MSRIKDLEKENNRLREDLWNEWEANHTEHCSREWPHPADRTIPCNWPQPESLVT